MKIVKFILFFLILTSCNKYLGTIEPDYEPKNEVTNIFEKDYNQSPSLNNFQINEKHFLNNNKHISANISFKDANKLFSTDSETRLSFNDNTLIKSTKDEVTIFNLGDLKTIEKYDISLEKNELVLDIIAYKENIFLLTNQSSLYEIVGESIVLINRFDVLSEIKPILIGGDLYILSVFGELHKLDLLNFTILSQGKFSTNYGLSALSEVNHYQNYTSYLFNSGTPIFINEDTKSVEDTYYFEDLNILTSLGAFEDLISVPLSLNNNLLFIDRSGKISQFNPLTSIISWELDLNEPIKDFIYSNNEDLIVLTTSNIFFIQKGEITYRNKHLIENPFKIFLHNNDLLIVSDMGVSHFDESGNTNIILKQKFIDSIDITIYKSKIYLNDSKALFILSE